MTERALHIVHFLPRIRMEEGGVVRSVVDMIGSLAEAGQGVTLLTFDAADAPEAWCNSSAGPRVVVIPPLGMFGRHAPQAARRILEGADALHLHTPWERGNATLAREARRLGLPYVISAHGMLDDWSMAQRHFKKEAYLWCIGTRLLEDAAFVHCTAQAEHAQAARHFPQGNGRVIPLVFDIAAYESAPGPAVAHELWPELGADRPTILFLSRLHYKKGVDLLLDVAAELRSRGHEFTLVIAGSGEAEYVENLKVRARHLGLSEHTLFTGHVDGEEKISLYESADVFVLPTSQENFGFVFFESLAAGTPLVTTPGVDTWPELEESGGALIAPRDIGPLCDAVESLLRDEPLRRRMGEAGRRWTLQRFAGSRVAREYIELYGAMADARKKPEPVTLDLLRRTARKGGASSGDDPYWVSKYFYRHITIYFTWVCARLGLSANGVTLLSALAVFAGAVAYGMKSPGAWLVGALFVQLYFILDHVDGEMARFERIVKRRSSGMAGLFYDTACHAGETAVLAAIALRLSLDLGGAWWVTLTLIVALFPGGIDPWQRYAESVLARAAQVVRDGSAVIDARFLQKTSLSLAGQNESRMRRAVGIASQTIGFPGYFVTLLVCTILDVAGVPAIEIAGVRLPYLYLWLLSRAALKAAAGLKSTFVYGRRLRALG